MYWLEYPYIVHWISIIYFIKRFLFVRIFACINLKYDSNLMNYVLECYFDNKDFLDLIKYENNLINHDPLYIYLISMPIKFVKFYGIEICALIIWQIV